MLWKAVQWEIHLINVKNEGGRGQTIKTLSDNWHFKLLDFLECTNINGYIKFNFIEELN